MKLNLLNNRMLYWYLTQCGRVVFLCSLFLLAQCLGRTTWPDELLSNVSRITSEHGTYHVPRWAPNGKTIAYLGTEKGGSAIFEINQDGSPLRRLVASEYSPGEFDWSPDGTKIIFGGTRNGVNHLFLRNDDESIVSLLESSDKSINCARWAPDGKIIAFCSGPRVAPGQRSNTQIFTSKPDGTEIAQLTQLPLGNVRSIEWSPDGTKLLFTADRVDPEGKRLAGETGSHLFVMNVDGSGLMEPDSITGTFEATWSPDSKKILYSFFGTITEQISLETGFYLVDLNGAPPRQTVLSKFRCLSPNWSPNLNKLVFLCEDTSLQGYLFEMDMQQSLK